jgi:hypothetical protein
MASVTQTTQVSKIMLWAGYIISALPLVALIPSAVIKFINPPFQAEGFAHLGYDAKLALSLGIVELTCTILYIVPRTAVLGAILLTGYMGGAIATHLRVGEQFITQIIIGVFVWLGLYLRDARLRALIPLRKSEFA